MATPRRRPAARLGALILTLGCGVSEPAPPPRAAAPSEAVAVPAVEPSTEPAGEAAPGFVVWESNRSGAWRLWVGDLGGRGARQLTADERGRRHCCPHIAPDGSRVAYLSLPDGREYEDERAVGELRVMAPDGGGERRLSAAARTYFEHRAAVWVDPRTLHYIAEDGAVERLDVDSGARVRVLPGGDLARRWLVDASGRWAATGRGAFAAVRGGRLAQETPIPGCQPYFSHDGRWGVWTAGSGGPIDRLDLATGETSTLLAKNDPRLPAGRGYLYFPMLSVDGTLLAFAASGGAHDHFAADYDILVAEIDPQTLEVLGRPWIVAPSPAVDRFPDIWRPTLGLGRTVGVAPLAVSVASPDGGIWDWALAGSRRSAARFEKELREPGIYALTARSGDRLEHGVVVVESRPLPPARNTGWPARADSLLWAWSADGVGPTTELLRDGTPLPASAPLDLAAGAVAAADSAARLQEGLQGTNQFTLELLLTPPAPQGVATAAILAVGADRRRENLLLAQRGGRLILRLRVGSKGAEAYDEVDLGPLVSGRRVHLALSYSPGRTTLYVDGRQALFSRELRGYFFHWRAYPLTLGDRARGGAPWRGRIEALALWNRPLTAAEVAVDAGLLSGVASSRTPTP